MGNNILRKGLNTMKKEYEVPLMDIVKFSMDTDVMTASADSGDFNELPSGSSL